MSCAQVLCADEPTSGLDSFTAFTIVQCLRNLAAGPRRTTLICSIHQPRADVFQLFDKVLLLGLGGRPVYFGLVRDMVKYFGELGHHCPLASNPADFFVDLCSVDLRNESIADIDRYRLNSLAESADSSCNSVEFLAASIGIKNIDIDEVYSLERKAEVRIERSKVPWLVQATVLFQRFALNNRRDPYNVYGGLFQCECY